MATKHLIFLAAESACPICGRRARLLKTTLGWMCATCQKRLFEGK